MTKRRRNKTYLFSRAQRNHEKRLRKWNESFQPGTLLSHTNELWARTMAQSPPGTTWTTRTDLTCTFYRWTDDGLAIRLSPEADEAIFVVQNLGRGHEPYGHIWYLKVLIGEELGKVAVPFYFSGPVATYLRVPENFFKFLLVPDQKTDEPQ